MSGSNFQDFQQSMGRAGSLFSYIGAGIFLVFAIILGIVFIYFGATDQIVQIDCKQDSDCKDGSKCNANNVCEGTLTPKKHPLSIIGGIFLILLGIGIFFLYRWIYNTAKTNSDVATYYGTVTEAELLRTVF